MQGRRRYDVAPYDLEPGDYTKRECTNVDETEHWVMWFVRAPDGAVFYLCNEHHRDRNGRFHQVEEHEDGTVTVEPHPENSNSILSPKGWHGYIRQGVWESC